MYEEPHVVRIWPPSAVAPLDGINLNRTLAFDRDLLQTNDATFSRTENAPKLTPREGFGVELSLPERTARPVLVLGNTSFAQMQRSLPASPHPWLVAPAEFGRRGRIVAGQKVIFGLARSMWWHEPGPNHYLMPLGSAMWVKPGQRVELAAPSVCVIGDAAFDVSPDTTAVPETRPTASSAAQPLRVEPLAVTERHMDALGRFPQQPLDTLLHIAEQPEAIALMRAPALLSPFLRSPHTNHRLLPALVREQPRLLFVYAQPDDTCGVLLSGHDLQGWLDQLANVLGQPPGVARVALGSQPQRDATSHAGVLAVADARPTQWTKTVYPSGEHPLPAYSPSAPSAQSPHVLPSLPSSAARDSTSLLNALSSDGGRVEYGGFASKNPDLASQLRMLTYDRNELGVLILGETGTGKGRLARVIHDRSMRARGPFVTVNCAAIAKGVMDSELFGHSRGAFTGALSREGLVATAHRGTLFLDEIGDAPMNVQLALLRLLDDGFIRPVGADRERRVDVRALAATSAPLEKLVEQGTFKRDLFYRLANLQVRLPPLRERLEDLPEICEEILDGEGCQARLTPKALERLAGYHWPGNIRELRSILLQAINLAGDVTRLEEFLFSHLPETRRAADPGPPPIRASSEVLEHAALLWTANLPEDDERRAQLSVEVREPTWPSNAYHARACKRAALIEISLQHPRDTWPPRIVGLWKKQFREGWHLSEEGRGRRDLMKRLGMDEKDEHATRWLVQWVGGG